MAAALVAFFKERGVTVHLEIASRFVLDHAHHREVKTRIERGVGQRFILSTNFFSELAADESRTADALRYVAYADPYVSVCYGPLRGLG